jgi:hypothetical protein
MLVWNTVRTSEMEEHLRCYRQRGFGARLGTSIASMLCPRHSNGALSFECDIREDNPAFNTGNLLRVAGG